MAVLRAAAHAYADRVLGGAVRIGTDEYGILRSDGAEPAPRRLRYFAPRILRTGPDNAISVPIRTYPYLSVLHVGFPSAAGIRVSAISSFISHHS